MEKRIDPRVLTDATIGCMSCDDRLPIKVNLCNLDGLHAAISKECQACYWSEPLFAVKGVAGWCVWCPECCDKGLHKPGAWS